MVINAIEFPLKTFPSLRFAPDLDVVVDSPVLVPVLVGAPNVIVPVSEVKEVASAVNPIS
jgi:hypothetical protein